MLKSIINNSCFRNAKCHRGCSFQGMTFFPNEPLTDYLFCVIFQISVSISCAPRIAWELRPFKLHWFHNFPMSHCAQSHIPLYSDVWWSKTVFILAQIVADSILVCVEKCTRTQRSSHCLHRTAIWTWEDSRFSSASDWAPENSWWEFYRCRFDIGTLWLTVFCTISSTVLFQVSFSHELGLLNQPTMISPALSILNSLLQSSIFLNV